MMFLHFKYLLAALQITGFSAVMKTNLRHHFTLFKLVPSILKFDNINLGTLLGYSLFRDNAS